MQSIALKIVTKHSEHALKPKTALVSYYLTAQHVGVQEDVGDYLIPAVQEYIKALRAYGKAAEMQPLDELCMTLDQQEGY